MVIIITILYKYILKLILVTCMVIITILYKHVLILVTSDVKVKIRF